jgi:serine protease inhibitor
MTPPSFAFIPSSGQPPLAPSLIPNVIFQLGVEAIFNLGEFDNISPDEPFKVSQVVHKATVEVDREGTVGAAATGK